MKSTKLKFNEEKHEYSVNGKVLSSVTEFISTFLEPFDRDYWSKYVADRDCNSQENILKQWEMKRDWGSKVHKLIEDHINGEKTEDHHNEVREAINFLKSIPHTKIKSELRVHSEELMIAGTIDVVLETPEGVMLFDWKTTSNLRMNNSFRQAKEPIEHLDDCNYVKFLLQLNLYKLLFERTYGKKVTGMGFVKLARKGEFQYFPAEDLTLEVDLMLDARKIRELE